MSDDIYSGELHAWIEPEIEARVVALVLGEASEFEAEELERLMEERPEIRVFKRRLETLHGLLGSALAPEDDEEWSLSPEKRDELLTAIELKPAAKEVAVMEPVATGKAKERRIRKAGRRVLWSLAACFAITLFAFAMLTRAWKAGARNAVDEFAMMDGVADSQGREARAGDDGGKWSYLRKRAAPASKVADDFFGDRPASGGDAVLADEFVTEEESRGARAQLQRLGEMLSGESRQDNRRDESRDGSALAKHPVDSLETLNEPMSGLQAGESVRGLVENARRQAGGADGASILPGFAPADPNAPLVVDSPATGIEVTREFTSPNEFEPPEIAEPSAKPAGAMAGGRSGEGKAEGLAERGKANAFEREDLVRDSRAGREKQLKQVEDFPQTAATPTPSEPGEARGDPYEPVGELRVQPTMQPPARRPGLAQQQGQAKDVPTGAEKWDEAESQPEGQDQLDRKLATRGRVGDSRSMTRRASGPPATEGTEPAPEPDPAGAPVTRAAIAGKDLQESEAVESLVSGNEGGRSLPGPGGEDRLASELSVTGGRGGANRSRGLHFDVSQPGEPSGGANGKAAETAPGKSVPLGTTGFIAQDDFDRDAQSDYGTFRREAEDGESDNDGAKEETRATLLTEFAPNWGTFGRPSRGEPHGESALESKAGLSEQPAGGGPDGAQQGDASLSLGLGSTPYSVELERDSKVDADQDVSVGVWDMDVHGAIPVAGEETAKKNVAGTPEERDRWKWAYENARTRADEGLAIEKETATQLGYVDHEPRLGLIRRYKGQEDQLGLGRETATAESQTEFSRELGDVPYPDVHFGYGNGQTFRAKREWYDFALQSPTDKSVATPAEKYEGATFSLIDRVPILPGIVNETEVSNQVTEEVRYSIDAADPVGDPAATREIGVTMAVEPALLPDGTIELKMHPRTAQIVEEVIGGSGQRYGQVSESMIEKVSRVPEGHSLVLSGFYGQVKQKDEAKVPILGDTPVINMFFRDEQTRQEDPNIAFVLTPKTIKSDSGGEDQVLIEMKVLDVNSAAAGQSGVDWTSSLSASGVPLESIGSLNSLFGIEGQVNAGTFDGSVVLSAAQAENVLAALESNGVATLLSTPTVVTKASDATASAEGETPGEDQAAAYDPKAAERAGPVRRKEWEMPLAAWQKLRRGEALKEETLNAKDLLATDDGWVPGAGAAEAFASYGIDFPEGTSVRYDTSSGTLVAANTSEKLARISEIVARAIQQVKIEAEALDELELSAAVEPTSTFSLHVSDVSFKLAKAALDRGEWPAADQVRVEEFVNAFDYGDPAPTQDEKVACALEQAAHPFLQQRNLLRISMRTAALGRAEGTPLRLTVLLDKSGSMERLDRAESVHNAFNLLAAQLAGHDQVTLLSFARTTRLLADRVSGEEAGRLAELVAATPSEGGTNLEEALRVGIEKAREQFVTGGQNRIILLTDGAANLGNAKPEDLATLVEEMRQHGIAFDACGVGAEGLNDEILESLTRKGDGRYYFLDRPEDADDGFARQIAGALRPAARNVKVQVIFNPERVGRYRLYGFEKHLLKKEDFRNDSVDAAELAAEEAGNAMYHIEVRPEGVGEIGTVSVRFQDMASGQMVEKEWTIPYNSRAPRLEEAQPSMQLAGGAALLGERLKGSPVGEAVELDRLGPLLSTLPGSYPADARVKELAAMAAKMRELAGE